MAVVAYRVFSDRLIGQEDVLIGQAPPLDAGAAVVEAAAWDAATSAPMRPICPVGVAVLRAVELHPSSEHLKKAVVIRGPGGSSHVAVGRENPPRPRIGGETLARGRRQAACRPASGTQFSEGAVICFVSRFCVRVENVPAGFRVVLALGLIGHRVIHEVMEWLALVTLPSELPPLRDARLRDPGKGIVVHAAPIATQVDLILVAAETHVPECAPALRLAKSHIARAGATIVVFKSDRRASIQSAANHNACADGITFASW